MRTPLILGKTESSANWRRAIPFIHVQMGCCSFTELSVVPLSKLQTTLFLHAPYIVPQREYKVCWSWMMTPDAGHGQLCRRSSNLHLSLFSKRPLHREREKVHVHTICARRSSTPYKLSKCTLCTGVLTEKRTVVTLSSFFVIYFLLTTQ